MVRAGLLGEVYFIGDKFEAVWMGGDGEVRSKMFGNYEQAVKTVARHEASGFRFHDLRDSYGTWLADDGPEICSPMPIEVPAAFSLPRRRLSG